MASSRPGLRASTSKKSNHAAGRFHVRLLCVIAVLTLALTSNLLFNWVSLRNALADTAPQAIPFSQNWATTTLITADDNWSGVPGIIGYRGDALTGATGVDPQTVVADGSATPVDVNANRSDPNTFTTGGVTEFDGIGNPVVALQGSGTARAPHIVITLNTTGTTAINVSYNLRDIDGSADNSVQPVALQYRVGASGNYTNLAAGFVADASSGPSLATLVTPVSVTLPAACENQPVVQLRIITTDAVGSDEWIGIDDISITGAGVDAAPSVSSTTPSNNATNIATNTDITTTFSEPVNVTGSWFQINCTSSGAHTAAVSGGPTAFTLNPDSDFTLGDVCTVTINHLLVNDQDANDPPDIMAADYVFSFSVGPTLSINDVSQAETNVGTTTFTFNVNLSAASASDVTFNIATADGTAQDGNPGGEDNDYVAKSETGRTITAGNSSATFTVTVNGDATVEPNETFFVNISSVTGAAVVDAQGLGTIVNDDGVGAPSVVISQVYGGGGNSGATYRNDFIELYNRGAAPVDLSGWSVQFTAVTDVFAATNPMTGTPLTTNLTGIIQPGHYFLIQEAAGANVTTSVLLPTADVTGAIAVGSTGGKVALVNNTTVLSGTCPNFAANGIVDFVGYGATNCSETAPTGGTTNLVAAIRNYNGCQDTDNNNFDFSVSGGPTPRNSSNSNTCATSGPLSANGAASPNSLDPGGSTLLTVSVTPATGPPSTAITVTGNLTSIGGSASQQFYDDGTHGDVNIGDNVFSFFAPTPANGSGAYSISFIATDGQARNASGTITLSLTLPTCGVERWSVKVGTDPDAGLVNLASTTPVTLATMRGWPAPGSPPLNARVAPYETTAWVVNGTLINYKEEDDVDYHIVIQDGAGNTIITEVPCPCCGIGSPFQSRMAVARQTFDSRLTAQTFFQNPNIPVRITGIGFFDFLHGQTGVAPNGIEIHTILDISFPTTQTASTGTGANVSVQAGDVTLRFGNVSAGGTTTVAPIDPSTAGPALGGYSLVGPAFNITTAATSTGPYNICISVPYITDPVAFQKLKILHNEGGTLIDRTTGQDPVNKLVCGNAPSLSPFVVALGSTPTATNGNIRGHLSDNNGNSVEGAAIRLSGTQNRLMVTDSNGDYNFDNVETGGVYTVTPSRANFSFSPVQRSFTISGQNTDAAFTGSANGAANPLDRTEYFVRQQYVDFLGREPDEAGLNFWVNNIERCGGDSSCRELKRRDTSAAFFLSIEFQQTGYFVDLLYKSAFGNLPGGNVPVRFGEFKPDAQQVGQGVIVNQSGWEQRLADNKESFAAGFVQRFRFASAYPITMTPGQFVDRLYANAGVTPAATDREAAVNEFGLVANTSDEAARGRALRRVAENSALAESEFNRAFVLMQYFGYLRRDPNAAPDGDFSGYNFWLQKLDGFNGNYANAQMVEAFLVAGEYRQRFPR